MEIIFEFCGLKLVSRSIRSIRSSLNIKDTDAYTCFWKLLRYITLCLDILFYIPNSFPILIVIKFKIQVKIKYQAAMTWHILYDVILNISLYSRINHLSSRKLEFILLIDYICGLYLWTKRLWKRRAMVNSVKRRQWKLCFRTKIIWVKVFKNGPNKICGRQPLKNLKWYGLLKAAFHKFYLVYSWIPWLIFNMP